MGKSVLAALCAFCATALGTFLYYERAAVPTSVNKAPNLPAPLQGLRLPQAVAAQGVESSDRVAFVDREKIESARDEAASIDLFKRYTALDVTDPIGARHLLDESLQKDHYNVESLAQISDALLSEHKWDEAKSAAIRCLSIDEDNELCNRSLITSLTQLGNIEEAYPYLRSCLQRDPENVPCLAAMTQYHVETAQFDLVQQELRQLEAACLDGFEYACSQRKRIESL